METLGLPMDKSFRMQGDSHNRGRCQHGLALRKILCGRCPCRYRESVLPFGSAGARERLCSRSNQSDHATDHVTGQAVPGRAEAPAATSAEGRLVARRA
jgi:hypothetical protein